MKIKKVGIIGVGFMGASLALAVKKRFPHISIWGYARSKKSFNKLKKLNILDRVSRSLEEVIRGCDLVVLAAPILAIVDYIKEINDFLKEGAVIIDLGSTKSMIDRKAKKNLSKKVSFVGCHPLCGSEMQGAENANKDLYKNAICIVTSRNKAAEFIKKFWQELGCQVYYLNPFLHDKILSYISHLPHIISFSLTWLVSKKYFKFVSSSFKDSTRVSSSSSQIWADIFLSNRSNLLKNIKEYIKILKSFESFIKDKNKTKLLEIIKKVNLKQNTFHQ